MGKKYYSKYLILAIIGSIIIGLAFYLLLNNYLDKKEIIVASRNINAGEKVSEGDLDFKEYYKNSLPENYLINKKDIVGKIIDNERRKDDYISSDMLSKEAQTSFFGGLSAGDVLITVNVQYTEPILRELTIGNHISIVSTVYDKDSIYSEYIDFSNTDNSKSLNLGNNDNDNYITGKNKYSLVKGDYVDNATFKLSDNVMLINGQIIVRNLEIICIEKDILNGSKNILLNNNITSVYLKCNIKEAPFVARLTKGDDYKIIVEDI